MSVVPKQNPNLKSQPRRVRIHCAITGWEGWIFQTTDHAASSYGLPVCVREEDGQALDDLTVSLARILETDPEVSP